MMLEILGPRWTGPRYTLESAVRRFLRARSRSYLGRLLGDRGFAVAAAVSLAATGMTGALPPVELSDVVAGTGGFVMNGIAAYDFAGFSVSDAGDVNGDGWADLIVGAYIADPGGNTNAGESYVVLGRLDCPGDCGGDNDANVGIVDFLGLLSQWGGPGTCDFDGGGVGIVDFLEMLANWGPCP